MAQRHIVRWVWVANAVGLLIAAVIFTALASSDQDSATSSTTAGSTSSEPYPSPAQQCAATARLALDRLIDQGYDPTVIWSTYQVGSMGQAEYHAYRAGALALAMQAQLRPGSDGGELWDAYMNGAYGIVQEQYTPGVNATCVEYYGD
ncbi:hypothetical protein E1161_09880 [Saccharopolyspora aridisoli]|uniref:Uncharacterized protein n=1 Tax=Saccharopolyspora aridisoli TaxID=2530385 RepID=A0A4V2Y7W9_9PSEU|nr:hypothetical protein [Saccharopolyspora aridisoli]TDC93725.1 hypothetical protein E1161_09880 [Saccharopolyspora aridisoli]